MFATEGAEVVMLDVDREGAETVATEIDAETGSARAVGCDLTDREAVASTVEALREETGGIDVLVNNAAMVDARSRVAEYGDGIRDRDVAINLTGTYNITREGCSRSRAPRRACTGTYNITREVFPAMCERGWGRVVSMSPMAGWQGGFGQISYSATKAAIVGLGKTLALEGAQQGVTSNVVAPSIVVEALADMPLEDLEDVDSYFARIAKATPMRRLGREADVANTVAFLASEQASYITGQVVGVTGGIDLFSF